MPANLWRRLPAFYNLKGTRCQECKELQFPSVHACKECGSRKVEDFTYNGKGKIVTFTIIRQPFNDSETSSRLISESPYVICIVKLEEGPMITAQISDSSPPDVQIGQNVKAVFRKISEEGEEGLIKYGYKFVLQ